MSQHYSSLLPKPMDGIGDTLKKILLVLLNIQTGGGVAGGQVVIYTSGTPPDPADISKPALAYDPNGILPTLGWNTVTHTWG